MRWAFVFILLLFCGAAATGQNKPVIIGQKELSTTQGKPITIQLSDLYVQETPDPDEDNGGGNETPGDDDSDGGSNDDDNPPDGGSDDGDDDGGNEETDDDDADDGSTDDDDATDDGDDSDDAGDNDNGPGKGKGKDKDKDKDKDKGKGKGDNKGDDKDKGKGKDDKKDKDKGEGKGKGKNKGGNGRATYPEGYTLEVFPGNNYSVSGNIITPVPSFSGTLTVTVRVKNARYASPAYDAKILVKAIVPSNVAPVITGQLNLKTPMGKTIDVKLSHLQVTDPDDAYPEGFTLRLRDGENYDLANGTSVVPSAGFSGNLTVPAIVNDGTADSPPFDLRITVTAPAAPANAAPKITGQLPISISVNQPIRIVLTQLLVTDPDNDFPEDFALRVFPGSGYAVNNTTVTPAANYQGTLNVKVSVSDGHSESAPFNLAITVSPEANRKPLITGQVGLRIREGENLQVRLSHLVVDDPDNTYPDDFQLTVLPGENFSVSEKTVTPSPGFLGTLKIPVTVNDGKVVSDPFILSVEVVPKDRLAIVGQEMLEVPEDSSLVLRPQYLLVNDPEGVYPDGFILNIGTGANFTSQGNRITPARNYFGNLTVPVTVTHNGVQSDPFDLLIVVDAVNDAPEVIGLSEEPLVINAGSSVSIFNEAEIFDEDDTHLLFAEVSIRDGYTPGGDLLEWVPSDSLHMIFDEESGTLFLVGRASLELYQEVIRSIKYTGNNESDTLLQAGSKTVSLELNDGKITSARYDRMLRFGEDLPLDIPTAFTPNNDNANDTGRIAGVGTSELINTTIRVYDKKGIIVFESRALEQEWDGQFNGSPLPADVYYYTIELDLAYRKLNFKGIVAILR